MICDALDASVVGSPATRPGGVNIVFCQEGKGGTSPDVKPARVLVVEDNYFVSIEIEETLAEIGCEVIDVLPTAEEAIEVASRARPDLILMDIRLAGTLDGIDAAIEIYNQLGIRSVFLTAHSDPGTRKRGERANPVGWASKPFSSQQLGSYIKSALDALRRS